MIFLRPLNRVIRIQDWLLVVHTRQVTPAVHSFSPIYYYLLSTKQGSGIIAVFGLPVDKTEDFLSLTHRWLLFRPETNGAVV
jgi:hypothetical protein